MPHPILLSPPHIGTAELAFVQQALETHWLAPVGPHVDAFEHDLCQRVGAPYGVAVSSGTAALYLAMRLIHLQPGDEVFCSTLTSIATANPIVYQGARPVFLDSDRSTWTMDPNLLQDALTQRARTGRLPKAVVVVHLYGQSADLAPILEVCDRYEIPVIEDAAESLGATCHGRAAGTLGHLGIYSFNTNKIITTSGGGLLICPTPELAARARFLATQARDSMPYYHHREAGYNYRLSNVLAGIGRGQLPVLSERVEARRRNFDRYYQALGPLPGVEFMPEAPYGRSTRWLTCLTLDAERFGCDREQMGIALARGNIETRPVWNPLHLHPVFRHYETIGGQVAKDLFQRGLCLPSGSNLTVDDLNRVIETFLSTYHHTDQHRAMLARG